MPRNRQGFYSLMIHVNMAHCLHFYRKAERNNTIAKIQPIWEKKNKKQHLTAQNALHPREKPQLLLHVRKRRTLGEVIAEMEMAVCMFVHVLSVFLFVCVTVCRVGCGGKGMARKALSKKIFQKHFALVTLTRAVDWRALFDRNQGYQTIWLALGMARSSGRGLSGKWCCSRHSLSTTGVYLRLCECWGWQSIQSKLWLKKPRVLKDQNPVWRGECECLRILLWKQCNAVRHREGKKCWQKT